ncbi:MULTISPECIES: hypothetical protein [Ferrimicrobium]|uniref:hypothetical protein n=1 Tax=Ferrimicrobium TaxID=121038 RepID=UPI0023F03E4F|nr:MULTISPECIES: hypothetical protein [Ferrimicrobium]
MTERALKFAGLIEFDGSLERVATSSRQRIDSDNWITGMSDVAGYSVSVRNQRVSVNNREGSLGRVSTINTGVVLSALSVE